MSSSKNPFADRPECSSCGNYITTRTSLFLGECDDDDDDEDEDSGLKCATCRDPTDNREPPEVECPVCDELPMEEETRRSLNGESLEGVRICFINSGKVNIHREDEDDE